MAFQKHGEGRILRDEDQRKIAAQSEWTDEDDEELEAELADDEDDADAVDDEDDADAVDDVYEFE